MDTFRKEYKPLTVIQKVRVSNIKAAADNLLDFIFPVIHPEAEVTSEQARCKALAKTNLEQAVMWAVKGITG